MELRIFLGAISIQVLDALPEFRLVHRNLRAHALGHARVALEIYAGRAIAAFDLRGRTRPPALKNDEIALLIGFGGAPAPATAPHAAQVGMTIGGARCWCVLLLLCSGGRWSGWLTTVLRRRREGHEGHRRRCRSGDAEPFQLNHWLM